MASPGELVQAVAEVLGVPEPTVIQHDRILAAAGLRTKGGRGLSAAHVTSDDAANLLISICGAPLFGASVAEAAATCKRYGFLKAYRSGKLANFSTVKEQFPTLGKLPSGHMFREAISALIDSLMADEFGPAGGTVHVHFDGAIPRGGIDIKARRSAFLSYRETADIHFDKKDLSQDRMFSVETLSEIASVIGRNTRKKDNAQPSKRVD
jgi:hypothetical protein